MGESYIIYTGKSDLGEEMLNFLKDKEISYVEVYSGEGWSSHVKCPSGEIYGETRFSYLKDLIREGKGKNNISKLVKNNNTFIPKKFNF